MHMHWPRKCTCKAVWGFAPTCQCTHVRLSVVVVAVVVVVVVVVVTVFVVTVVVVMVVVVLVVVVVVAPEQSNVCMASARR